MPFRGGVRSSSVRARRTADWTEQWKLAERVSPEGLIWPYPLEPGFFHPEGIGRLLGRERKAHLVRREGEELIGSLSVHGTTTRRFVLLVDPMLQGDIEESLLSPALRRESRRAIVMDYPSDVAVETLRNMGFRERRTLTWMRHSFRRAPQNAGV